MNLTERSSIGAVAIVVADALRAAGIRAVLSGGGCAAIHTNGIYRSVDLDFVLQTRVTQTDLERAMATAGFYRKGNQYFHDRAALYVEFPPGPLSIGRDYQIEPVELELGSSRILALSATDSCRDRLAAFLHWRDQQSLKTAVWIALQNEIDREKIRSWCATEGAAERFGEFTRAVEIARKERGRRRRQRRATRGRKTR
ncbi:MAG: hypothetical protein ACRD1P_00105 [Thermoanaerobaculia bacterium]